MVQIELADPAITVHGWMPSWDHLGAYRLRIRKTPEEMKEEKERYKKYGITKKVNPMRFEDRTVIDHEETDPSTVYFLPGLWPRIKGFFDKNNIQYEITADLRNPDIRPEIDFNAIKDIQFRDMQDLALALIATSDCGVIETNTGWGKSFLISVLCKAFPTLRILVCTGSTQVVGTLYEYLCKQIPGEVGILTGKKDNSHNKRVVVSTLRSLNKVPSEGPQLLLVDECHECGSNLAGKELMRFAFCRRFGFSASPIRNDGSGLALENLFGPTILKMDYDEAVDAGMVVPMKYTMLPCTWGPTICHKEDLSEIIMKRYGYWRNKARNRAIADMVYKILAVDPDIQILIVVATMEHAVELNQFLRNFKVAYYGSTNMEDLEKKFPKERYPNLDLKQYKMTSKQLDIMRAAFAKGTLKRIISTTVFRQGVSFDNLRVLVRADGATSKIMGIQIPGRLSRLHEDKFCGYLIDVDDDFCPWAKRRANSRKALYAEQKWTEITPAEVLHDIGSGT